MSGIIKTLPAFQGNSFINPSRQLTAINRRLHFEREVSHKEELLANYKSWSTPILATTLGISVAGLYMLSEQPDTLFYPSLSIYCTGLVSSAALVIKAFKLKFDVFDAITALRNYQSGYN